MQKSQESISLRRTGAVVVLAGIVQAALAMASAPAGSFHFQFANFNILFGLLIAFGNVRAVSAVRWLAWFGLMPAALLLLAGFLLQPAGLLLAQLRCIPGTLLHETAGQLISLAMLLFILHQLGSTPVLAARAALGRKVRDMRIPLVRSMPCSWRKRKWGRNTNTLPAISISSSARTAGCWPACSCGTTGNCARSRSSGANPDYTLITTLPKCWPEARCW